MVGDRMRSTCAEDMSKMGLEVVSFTIKEVRDKNEYIANMGRPDVARIKRDADVAAAEAERDTAIKRAEAMRAAAVAKAQADQERVLAETISMAKQAEAQRDLELKKAEYLEAMKKKQAQADKAYDIQSNVMQQQVIAEAVKVRQVEKEQEIKVQEAEILRHEKELIATTLKGAEIERQRIETLAAADKARVIAEAEGRAAQKRLDGEADADIIRKKGSAEAEIILSKGEAEAKAMNVKAEAYQEWNPGGGGGQTHHRHAGSGPRAGFAAGTRGQDHHCFHRRRQYRRHEQDHRRHGRHGGPDSRFVRDAVRHEDVGTAGQSEADWRQRHGRQIRRVERGG